MKPGPKPKPTAMKELQGNPGRRPLPEHEPRLQPVVLRKERGLADRKPHAAQFYDWLAKLLGEVGVTTELDRPAFYVMADAWADFRRAEEILDKEGLMTVDERGLPRKHPMIQVKRDAREALYRYLGTFGLTPGDRSRIIAMEAPEELSLVDVLYGEAGFE